MGKSDFSKAEGRLPGAGSQIAWTNNLQRGRVPGPRLPEHRSLPPDVGDATRCVHAGTYEDGRIGGVTTPLFSSSTFAFREATYESFFQGTTRDVPIYSRYGNPNQWSVQEKIATLEGAESAVVFSSGMAAIYNTLLALTNKGGHIISAHDVYGGTYNLFKEDLHQLGRSVSFVDGTDISAVRSAIRPETQMLFFETLSNPLLKAIPLVELGELAREQRLLLVVDNTFLTPILARPRQAGAHIVIHSCTKYMNGHSDLIAGVASGSRKYIDRVWAQMLKTGGQLDPAACLQLERGLKTLSLRMERHVYNGDTLARHLAQHSEVAHVYHPSLPDYPYPWVKSYCPRGYGGMLSFEVTGGDERAVRFIDHLQIPKVATSLGGVESLVSLPFNTSHSVLTERQRANMGIRPGLVRLSVGIEDVDDLKHDLDRALEASRATAGGE